MKKLFFISMICALTGLTGCASTEESGGDKSAKSESSTSARHCERTDTRIQRGC
ncbi:hypothetical protein [Alteromonas antoniana]|uniref:hypothetical protein n=1 Tax=Alteromonas antoniana TaxID=2803813 RepID=UPI001C45C869|nr:hypothetical protein [Alteromonas antoniana]